MTRLSGFDPARRVIYNRSTMLEVTPELRIPRDELRFSYVRSSGPGGQNVNKVASKAVLRWAVTTSPSLPEAVRQRFLARFGSRLTQEGELVLASQRYRDQGRNAEDCLEKVRAMLLEVARPPKRRRATRPTASSRAERLKTKREQSQKKQSRRRPKDFE